MHVLLMVSRTSTKLRRPANFRCHQALLKVIVLFLAVMVKNGYTGKFKIIRDLRAGITTGIITGRLNKCEGISSISDVKLKDLEDDRTISSHPICLSQCTVNFSSITDYDENTQEGKS